MSLVEKELASHPLIKEVMDNLRPLLKRNARKLMDLAEKGIVRSKEKDELFEYEWYDTEVFTHLSAIVFGIDRLKYSQNFIRTFPRLRSYEKEGIDQADWIEYHYSYYVITLVSLYDIALILTNAVFRLGNHERDCKPDLIKKNTWVRDTPVKQALDELDILVRRHREGRNLHVHRGQVQNIALVMESEDLDRLKLISSVHMYSEPIVDKEIVDLAYKGHVEEISSRLQEEKKQTQDAIWTLFDVLLPVYQEKATELKEKWVSILEKELEHRQVQKNGEEDQEVDIIDQLLEQPLKVKDFRPLSREDAHARK